MATRTDWPDATGPDPGLVVTIITKGSPEQLTGGYLFHRRLAEAGPANDARVEFVSAVPGRDPLAPARGVSVVDSIVAWCVTPWMWRHRRPVAAILHQPPGGIGAGRLRTAWQRPLDRACYRRCALLLPASAELGRSLAEDHGLDPQRIHVLEPGSDVAAPSDAVPDLRAGRRIAVLCVGNWLPSKGVLELLDAVGTLASEAVTLHLVGRADVDPTYASAVRARIARPDLSGRVVVHGPLARDRVGALYQAADAFALASYVETYGTVYGEALAAGLPTVGWAAGNLPHLVTDGQEGALAAPGDVPGLAAILERLASDERWRSELAAGARRRGATLPTWDQTASRFFDAIRSMTTPD